MDIKNRSRTNYFIILVVVSLVLISIGVTLIFTYLNKNSSPSSKAVTTTVLPDNLMHYENETYYFNFNYPKSWEKYQVSNSSIALEFGTERSSSVTVEADDVTDSMEYYSEGDQYNNLQLGIIEILVKDNGTVKEKTPLKISDLNGYKVIYDLKFLDVETTKLEAWVLKKIEGKTYEFNIKYSAKPANFEKDLIDVNNLISSFNISK